MVEFPPRLALANLPTPLIPLTQFSNSLGGPTIWVKRDDLTGSGLSGNKIRKLEFVTAQAKQQGADTLITCGGLQSNHCRATALVGAQLGLQVHLLLREEGSGEIDGNLLLDHLAGATIERIPKAKFVRELPELLAKRQQHYHQQGRTAHIIPTGASDGTGVWGYVRCIEELISDFQTHGIQPTKIVCATGSGGTQAGLSLGCQLFGLDVETIGYAVCDNEDYFTRKVKQDVEQCAAQFGLKESISNDLKTRTIDRYIGPGYAKGYPELYECIHSVARQTGLLLDPIYTGKAFFGLIEDIKNGLYANDQDVVFIHTGGTFGLFAHKHEFNF